MKNFIYKSVIICITLIIYSCEEFIEIDPPRNELSSEVIFKDVTTAEAFLAEIYAKVRDKSLLSGNNLGAYYTLSLYTDDLINNNAQYTAEQNFFNNNLLDTDHSVLTTWADNYHIIYLCNRFLEGVENADFPTNQKNFMSGQVLYLRSYIYYLMTKVFGDIPYTKSTDYETNKKLYKVKEEELYQFLKTDLLLSLENFNHNKDVLDKTKASYWSSKVLLAKILLETNENSLAIQHINEVLNGPFTIENVADKFLKNSRSTLFHFKPSQEGVSTHEGRLLIFTTLPPPSISLSNDLINSFETQDLRFIHWIKELNSDNQSYYHSFKYKQNQPSSNSLEYSVVVRIEEAYYIAIEALLKMGNTTEALTLWNEIREINGLPQWTTAPTNSIEELLSDKRKEFFCEKGMRFCDLKRNNKLNESMSITKASWKSHNQYWPIPLSEIMLNNNLLPQNNGY